MTKRLTHKGAGLAGAIAGAATVYFAIAQPAQERAEDLNNAIDDSVGITAIYQRAAKLEQEAQNFCNLSSFDQGHTQDFVENLIDRHDREDVSVDETLALLDMLAENDINIVGDLIIGSKEEAQYFKDERILLVDDNLSTENFKRLVTYLQEQNFSPENDIISLIKLPDASYSDPLQIVSSNKDGKTIVENGDYRFPMEINEDACP